MLSDDVCPSGWHRWRGPTDRCLQTAARRQEACKSSFFDGYLTLMTLVVYVNIQKHFFFCLLCSHIIYYLFFLI